MNWQKSFSKDLLKILAKAADNRIYGSVEIYFEAGSITQITQRIINKVTQPKKVLPKRITGQNQAVKDISVPYK